MSSKFSKLPPRCYMLIDKGLAPPSVFWFKTDSTLCFDKSIFGLSKFKPIVVYKVIEQYWHLITVEPINFLRYLILAKSSWVIELNLLLNNWRVPTTWDSPTCSSSVSEEIARLCILFNSKKLSDLPLNGKSDENYLPNDYYNLFGNVIPLISYN